MSPVAVWGYHPEATKWSSRGRADKSITPVIEPPIDPGLRPSRENTGWVRAGSPTLTSYAAGIKTGISSLTLVNRVVDGNLEFGDGCANVTLDGCVINGELKFREVTNVTILNTDAQAFVIDGAHGVDMGYNYTTGKLNTDGLQVKGDGGAVPTNIHVHHNFFGNATTTDAGHYDGIQVRGVVGLVIDYNTFDPSDTFNDNQNAAIFLQTANGGNYDVTIEHNWISAMGHGLLSLGAADPLKINYNVFYPDPMQGKIVKAISATIGEQIGNTWVDGTPIPNLLVA